MAVTVTESSDTDEFSVATTSDEEAIGSSIDIDISDIIDEVGATDRELIGGIWYIAKTAQRTRVIFDRESESTEIIHEDDNTVRLDALKTLAKMKGHLDNNRKRRHGKSNTKIKYVLINDTAK
jgi:hypothetical protein